MQKHILALGLLALAPAALWSQTVEITGYRAQLSPSNQVRADGEPIIANSFGAGNIWIRAERDADGNLTRAIVDFNVNWNIQRREGYMIRAFHIHVGGPEANGPVVVNPDIMPIMRDRAGAGRQFVQVVVDDAQGLERVQAILDNPGGHYVNLHTNLHRPGELRGQLRLRGEHTLDDVAVRITALEAASGVADEILDLLGRVAMRLGLRP